MTALIVIAGLWLFWGLYVLIMGLYRAQLAGRLTPAMRVLGAPFLVAGYVMDVATNLTLAAVVFAELPRELLVTTRLSRYLRRGDGWRSSVAMWVCQNILDPLDPRGQHCTTN